MSTLVWRESKKCFMNRGPRFIRIEWRPKLQVWDAFRDFESEGSNMMVRAITTPKLRTDNLLDAVAFVTSTASKRKDARKTD